MRTNHAAAAPLAAFALLLFSASCAAPEGAKGAADADEGGGCKARTARAVRQVQAAAERNRGCKADQDCVTAAISADCFDACTRNVNAVGARAVAAAIDEATASECGAFQAAGCNRVTPPCAPPGAPKCRAGLCE